MNSNSNSSPAIQIIAAVAHNRVIGRNGRLPWSLAADWNHFLQLTLGSTMIMGRTSFEDMLNEPRWADNGRDYCVISRNESFSDLGPVQVLSTPVAALEAAKKSAKPIWICGGAAVYAELMSQCQRLWLTLLDADFDGDTLFPEWRSAFPLCTELSSGEEKGLKFAFTIWDKPTRVSRDAK